MPESHLPEDLKRWPQDPYALLGVRPGASTKEVRQAYTRLIRQYKPEQYPEHFRRIRDAFENVQRYSQWNFPPPIEDPPAGGDGEEESPSRSVGDFLNMELSAEPLPFFAKRGREPGEPAGASTDELSQLWERACAGAEHEAYAALRQLADRPGNTAEVCLRLYWLARLVPEVDAECSPCHWLVRGLRSGDWYGPGRELYRREIERCPTEALSERFDELLRTEAPLSVLAEWLEWRWRAAGGLGRWGTILADLEAMRARFTAELNDENWARLLLSALDQLAWHTAAEAEQATRDFCAEIERLTHLHSRLDLHRLDILRDLSRAWKNLHRSGGVAAALLTLVPRSWTHSPYELRQPLQGVLKPLLHKPELGLEALDDLQHRALLVFAQLVYLIDGVSYDHYREHDYAAPTDLERAAAEFLELVPPGAVPARQDFLRFCVGEFVLPEEALRVMERVPGCSAILHPLREDASLRIVCVAYRWFWE